ncbi:hypothetical protein EU527_02355 [Candidatus Thorarchaeota archaeon]|nr:MAG: hypothetical protein EU527_02355 [Candidatus Thorarchaeota archaeon]
MALLQFILFIVLALNISAMFSGFMLARRMGFYLMNQVMALMFAMMVGIGALIVGLFMYPAAPAMFDLLHIILIIDFVLILLATLMQFGQILPILMKTMQGGPFHSSHITNLLVTLFALLGLVIYYAELAIM